MTLPHPVFLFFSSCPVAPAYRKGKGPVKRRFVQTDAMKLLRLGRSGGIVYPRHNPKRGRGATTWSVAAHTSVAVETIGNWYWIVDGVEGAGMVPQLAPPAGRR